MAYPHSFSCSRYVRKLSLPHTYHCPLPDGARCDHLRSLEAQADRLREEISTVEKLTAVEQGLTLQSQQGMEVLRHVLAEVHATWEMIEAHRIRAALAKPRPAEPVTTDEAAEADRAWREEAERIRPLLVEARDALHGVEALMIGSHPVESDRLCAVIPLDLGRRIREALAESRPGDAHKVEEHARSAESCRGQHEEQTRGELQAQLDREIAQHTACLLIAEGTALDTFGSYWFPPSGAMIAVEKLRQDCVQLRAREELRAASLFARSGRAGGCGDGAMSQPWEPPTTDAAKKVTP